MREVKHNLSVIVPVYNAEDRIVNCIESILNQTYSKFELILVDDGSTDMSGVLCEEYKRKDNRIITIHTKNSGPYQARKTGAERAHGEILTFSDSDDWFEANAFETAIEILNKNNLDIFLYTYICDNYYVEKNLYDKGVYSKVEIQEKIIPGMMYDSAVEGRRLNPSLSCKFIRKNLFEEVTKTVKDRITFGDDALVTYPAVCLAEKIYVCNKTLYHYSTNISSCMHTYPLERIKEVEAFQNNLIRLFDEMGMLNKLRYQIENYIRTFLGLMIKNWYGLELSPVVFSFPYNLISKGDKIFIYGAGKVGESYINELKITNYTDVVGWSDKNYETLETYNNVKIVSPDIIKEKIFDKLLIAILDEKIAYKIRLELIEKGVPEERIVWAKPLRIV